MTSSLNSALSSALADKQDALTKQLQKDAIKLGWPANVARSLSVHISEAGITVEYPESMDDAIGDLEYGGADNSPSVVFRMFDERHRDEILSYITDASVDYLIGKDIIP